MDSLPTTDTSKVPFAALMFGMAGMEHMKKYGNFMLLRHNNSECLTFLSHKKVALGPRRRPLYRCRPACEGETNLCPNAGSSIFLFGNYNYFNYFIITILLLRFL